MLEISSNHCAFGAVEKISHLNCSNSTIPVIEHTDQMKRLRYPMSTQDIVHTSRTLFPIPDDKLSSFHRDDSSSQSDSFSLTLPTPRHANGSSDSILRKSSASPASRMSRIFTELSNDALDSLVVDPPLVEYLARHRAISEDSVRQILDSDQCKRGPLLLNAIGLPQMDSSSPKSNYALSFSPPPGLALLLNALRQTGHHELASYLDFSRRITPASKSVQGDSDSGKSSCAPRRRGQLSLWVQLVAIKVSPVIYKYLDLQSSSDELSCSTATTTGNTVASSEAATTKTALNSEQRDNLAKEDDQPLSQHYSPMLPSFVEVLKPTPNIREMKAKRSKSKLSHQPKKSLTTSMWIDHEDSSDHKSETSSVIASPPASMEPLPDDQDSDHQTFLCCFRKRPKKDRKRPNRKLPTHSSSDSLSNNPTPNNLDPISDLPIHGAGDSCLPVTPLQQQQQKPSILSTRLELLDSKSDEFYRVLVNPDTPIHDAVVKYLEQSSGVLVLDCKLSPCMKTASLPSKCLSGSIVCIVIVATQTELVKRLCESCMTCCSSSDPSSVADNPNLLPTSRLSDDLVKVLIKSGILDHLQLQNLRLSVWLDPDEVELAIEELMDLTE